jgi:NhaA family Na+:H+ antiporter
VRSRPTTRDRRRILQPLQEFIATESASGAVLLLALLLALAWANSPWRDTYHDLWATWISLTVGSHSLGLDAQGWINDGLMTLFFLVVGLEVKREAVHGELRDPRKVALPIIAAIGGMLFPAAIYAACNAGTATFDGWGIPMATDVAIALSVLALLGTRVPSSLKAFLLTLAIADDIGAVLVIALFYPGQHVHPLGVIGAAALLLAGHAARRLGVSWAPVHVALGISAWILLRESGVHPTLVGVGLGLLMPAVARPPEESSPLDRLQHKVHPWVSFAILPLFILANSGIELSPTIVADSLTSRVGLGVCLGLVIGRLVGISIATGAAVKLRVSPLPTGVRAIHVLGAAALGGAGFTVSMFITEIALHDDRSTASAKVGILAASTIASLLGYAVLRGAGRTRPRLHTVSATKP